MERLQATLAAAALFGAAGMTPTPPPRQAQPIATVHLSVVASASDVDAAGKASLYLDISPKPKMHVYAPGEKDAIPVGLTLAPLRAIKPGKIVFPPPEKYLFAPLKLTQLVYSKPFRLTQPITIVNPPPGGTLTIKGTLDYQACDDAVCYVPKEVGVTWTLKIR